MPYPILNRLMRSNATISAGCPLIPDGYRLWECDNGMFDIVDDNGEVAYCNLGKDGEPETAVIELLSILNLSRS